MIVIVCSALITQDDQMLLVREKKVDKFGLPGGKLEEGESLRACLLREIKEELDAEIDIESLVRIVEKPRTHENNTVLRFIYRARIVSTGTESELSYGYYDQAQIESIVAEGKLRGKDVERLVGDNFAGVLGPLTEPELFT